jgi:diguanylate cyclase (GGDEF)-like protein
MSDSHNKAKATVMRSDRFATVVADSSPETEQDRHVHLVVMAGSPVGHIFSLTRGMNVIGRDEEAVISLGDPGISRHNSLVYFDPDLDAYILRDLGSRNGTKVNGDPITEPRKLERGDKIHVGLNTVLRVSFGDEVETRFAKQMLHETQRDGLTGVYNRRKLELSLEAAVPAARTTQTPLALVLFDIDRFKIINDTHGHPIGDAVLQWLCDQITPLLAEDQLLARYGGEEFVVLIEGGDEAKAAQLAETIRATIARAPYASEATASPQVTTQKLDLNTLSEEPLKVPVTVSLGVADLVSADARGMDLVQAADTALYSAKNSGRNRVIRSSQMPR